MQILSCDYSIPSSPVLYCWRHLFTFKSGPMSVMADDPVFQAAALPLIASPLPPKSSRHPFSLNPTNQSLYGSVLTTG